MTRRTLNAEAIYARVEREPDAKRTLEEVQRTFNVPIFGILGHSHEPHIVEARHRWWFLLSCAGTWPGARIARLVGANASTVNMALRKGIVAAALEVGAEPPYVAAGSRLRLRR